MDRDGTGVNAALEHDHVDGLWASGITFTTAVGAFFSRDQGGLVFTSTL